MPDVEVTRDDDAHRYVASIDGEQVGFAEYQLTDHLIVFTHTEVEDRCEGMGVGSTLVRGALDDVRRLGTRKVAPICPFVKSWISSHEDYQDLLYRAPVSTARD